MPVLSIIIQWEYSKYTNNSSYGEDSNAVMFTAKVRKTTKNKSIRIIFKSLSNNKIVTGK